MRRPCIYLQVQELHRLYRVQQLLMADAANEATMAMPPAATGRCNLEDDERRAAENDAGSSRSWDDAYSRRQQANNKAPPPLVLQESELELTLALGCFGTAAGKKATAAKKEASSSVDSRTSISASSTESGSSDCGVRRLPPSSGSVGQRLEQEGLPQPPWLHKCLNLAR